LLTGDFTNYSENGRPDQVVGEMAMLQQLSSVFAVEIEQGFTPASHR
jgi:hypothetical protein